MQPSNRYLQLMSDHMYHYHHYYSVIVLIYEINCIDLIFIYVCQSFSFELSNLCLDCVLTYCNCLLSDFFYLFSALCGVFVKCKQSTLLTAIRQDVRRLLLSPIIFTRNLSANYIIFLLLFGENSVTVYCRCHSVIVFLVGNFQTEVELTIFILIFFYLSIIWFIVHLHLFNYCTTLIIA